MKYSLLAISLLCLAYVMYDMSMWIIISSQTNSFEEAKNLDLSRYPQFLRDPIKTTLLNIFLAILAGSGFLRIRNTGNKVQSSLFKFLAGLAFFLASWQIFSLMQVKNVLIFWGRRAFNNSRLLFNELRETPAYCLLAIPFTSYKQFIYSDVLLKNWSFLLIGLFSLLLFSCRKFYTYSGRIEIKYIDLIIIFWSFLFLHKNQDNQQVQFDVVHFRFTLFASQLNNYHSKYHPVFWQYRASKATGFK